MNTKISNEILLDMHRRMVRIRLFEDAAGKLMEDGKIPGALHLYVGQEILTMSTVPVLARDGLKPRHTVLRSFLVSDEHDYMVMPGGLTRVSSEENKLVVSNQSQVISLETGRNKPRFFFLQKGINLEIAFEHNLF